MSKTPTLTKEQKELLSELEPALRACVKLADCENAEIIMHKIQKVLRPTGHITRLLQAKNWYYECVLESGQVEYAISGFTGNMKKSSSNTRLHLEALTLLGICYLRKKDIDNARLNIQKAMVKINNIKSDEKRRQFHKRFIERLEEESILVGLAEAGCDKLDGNDVQLEEIQQKAVHLLTTKSENELLEDVGQLVPRQSVDLFERIRDFSVNLLPYQDKKLLPSSVEVEKPIEIGKRTVSAIKKVAWRALCDPKSEIYKAWSQGLSVAYDKKYITAAVVGACKSWKITATMLVASIVAIIMKFTAAVFCEMFSPQPIMIHRSE